MLVFPNSGNMSEDDALKLCLASWGNNPPPAFSEAVFRYQFRNNLSPCDGLLGPHTTREGLARHGLRTREDFEAHIQQ